MNSAETKIESEKTYTFAVDSSVFLAELFKKNPKVPLPSLSQT